MTEPTATPLTTLEQVIIESAYNSGAELAHLDRHLADIGEVCVNLRALAVRGHPNGVGTRITELATKLNVARETADRAGQFRAHAEGAASALPPGHPWEVAMARILTGFASEAIAGVALDTMAGSNG